MIVCKNNEIFDERLNIYIFNIFYWNFFFSKEKIMINEIYSTDTYLVYFIEIL